MQPPQARQLILELLHAPLTRAGHAPHDHLDLIDAGILDSIAFLELLSALEAHSGTPIDLLQVDPASLTTIASLVALLSAP
ncbi:acyl carrier protein [Bradymonadaceae bacterium TMQ3]|uniref:Acyl carrier protein n=1 Tax=Lujinxingia sediminis TaxID=2480984 RepID=A0ABY0CQC3_9DELT|nr:acyl carrier protein [Bradymonadaceae bacterium TMQ3]RVU42685.1 acyl carrier protein [Lujinxingia sediminis]TXC75381.1 acyl carrier protein [Bradymonadales bacterium TMQ1]